MLLPLAIAFNCNSLGGGDLYVCNQIQATNLSSIEKDLLIADIFNKNKTTPNFDFIYSWNSNLNIQTPSDNKYYSSGTIQNAWIDIVALMPSMLENNTLYASNMGKLQTAYNFRYGSLPSGTEGRDCRTDYSWSSQTSNLNVYLNGNTIGTSEISSYQAYNTENLSFKSELSITARYKVTHYRYKWINNRQVCRSFSTEYRTDNLKISDSLNAKLYVSQLDSSFKIADKYFNVTKGIFTTSNFTNLILKFNNSQYQNTRYIYSLNYTLPYYILTPKVEPAESISSKNIHVDKNNNNFTFFVSDTSNCQIQLFDYFNSITRGCYLAFNQTNFSIRTDKTNYYENDTIKVYITPDNVLVNLTYGNQSKIVENYTELEPLLYENKINAQLNNQKVNVLINVTKREDITFLYDMWVLSFLGYFFFKSAKVYFLNFPI